MLAGRDLGVVQSSKQRGPERVQLVPAALSARGPEPTVLLDPLTAGDDLVGQRLAWQQLADAAEGCPAVQRPVQAQELADAHHVGHRFDAARQREEVTAERQATAPVASVVEGKRTGPVGCEMQPPALTIDDRDGATARWQQGQPPLTDVQQ